MRHRETVRSAAALLIVLGALVWGPTARFDYALDDRGIVYGNAMVERFDVAGIFGSHLRAGSTLEEEPDAVDFLYRPVTLLSFAVDRRLGGDGPGPGHVGNILLHAAAAFLAWRLFRALDLPAPVAAFGAMTALLHPVHVESVANIKHREEILAAIGLLAAWLLVEGAWRARDRARVAAWSVAAGAAFLAGMLAKESAAFALVAIPLASVLLHSREERPWPRIATVHAPLFLAAGVWFALRTAAIGTVATMGNEVFFLPTEGFWIRLLTSAKVWAVWYFGHGFLLLGYPAGISSRCVVPVEHGWPSLAAWAGLGLLGLSIAGAVVAYRRGRRDVSYWILFFWLALLPTSNLVIPIGSVGAFRFLYVPSLAWGALLGLAAVRLGRKGYTAAFVVLAIVFSVVAVRETRDWRNDETVNRSDLRRTSNPRARYVEAWRTEDPARREHWLRETARIMESVPGSARGMETTLLARTYTDLAEIELDRGAPGRADDEARKALAVLEPDPRYHRYRCFPLGVRARAAEARGDVSLAIRLWGESAAAQPLFAIAYLEKARLEAGSGSIEAARSTLRSGIAALGSAGRPWLVPDEELLRDTLDRLRPGAQ